jgi:alcohol dehydrogenase class IV
VLEWMLAFRKELNIPNSLGDIGVPTDRIADIGRMATEDPSAGGNPVELTADDYADIFQNACAGKLTAGRVAA